MRQRLPPDRLSGAFWLSAFLDFPVTEFDRGVEFWSEVTGYAVSPARGTEGEFATLVPPAGDDYLRVQRLGDGAGRIHLDLHVDDVDGATHAALDLGALVLVRHEQGYVVLASPGGLVFCLVGHRRSVRPAPARWQAGQRSLVDQVCLDIPPGAYDAECAFWRDLTGWELTPPTESEFRSLVRPAGVPLRLLLQRLDDDAPTVGAHLDVATTDRLAETLRHELLGARFVRRTREWTVLTDPVGTTYCITDRNPNTGVTGRRRGR